MKILLTTLNSKFAHSNLALRYLYFCINKEFDVEMKEFTINEEFFKVLSAINEVNADVIAFSCYIWNISQTLKICKAIKQVKPGTIIILGGPEVSYGIEELMRSNDFLDFIISGEGEESFPKLIKHLVNHSAKLDGINGVAYRQGTGTIKVSGRSSVIEDLSLIPLSYQGELSEFKQKIAYVESSRGCPYNCSYCLSSVTKGVRYFPLERVKGELYRLIKAGTRMVKFVDRTFNCDKKRAMEIWRFLLENKGNTRFHFELSGHILDDEMIEFLAEVPEGYFQFEIGVQSTYEDTVNAVNRKTDFSKLAEIVKRLRLKNNIHLHLDLIAGLPYENYERFGISFDEVYKLNPHMLQLGFLKFLKGSKIRTEKDIHRYKFLEEPPYEVLENKYISFNEIIKLKRIEEVLETYKNTGRFENSLAFILNNFAIRPFKLFEDLAEYWLNNQGFQRKISAEESYDLLVMFYHEKGWDRKELFKEVLKLDYIWNCFGCSIRPWQKKITIKNMKNIIYRILSDGSFIEKYIPHLSGMAMGSLLKRIHFEVFDFDVVEFKSEHSILVLFEHVTEAHTIKKAGYIKVESEYFKPREIIPG